MPHARNTSVFMGRLFTNNEKLDIIVHTYPEAAPEAAPFSCPEAAPYIDSYGTISHQAVSESSWKIIIISKDQLPRPQKFPRVVSKTNKMLDAPPTTMNPHKDIIIPIQD